MRNDWCSIERDASHRTGRAVLIGAAVAAGFFAFMQYFGRDAGTTIGSQEPDNSSETTTIVESPPTVIRAPSDQRGPSRPSGAYETQVGVYECTVDGQRIVSDRPCGADAEVRTLTIDQPAARDAMAARQSSVTGSASSVPRDSQPSTSYHAGTVDEPDRTAARCKAIDDAIDRINSRMRHPYTTYEGNYLRGEWHRLKNERYQLGCGR